VGAEFQLSAHPREGGDPGVFVQRLCNLARAQVMTAKFAKDAKSADGGSATELEPLARLASFAVKKTWVPAFAGMSKLKMGLEGIRS
jgi:hypothetical protein